MNKREGPIYADKKFLQAGIHEGGKEFGNVQPRLKDQIIYYNGADNLLEELQRQQISISQIVKHLQEQNEMLDDFKREALHKLGQNTKAAIRQQLGEINKEILRELREIKNVNTNIVEMLLSQERRMNKIQAALESIRIALTTV